jgi:hypothetical protein
MLSYDDCLGLSELRPDEIAAIARHKHVPEIVALAMGASLRLSLEGRQLMRRMAVVDSAEAMPVCDFVR